MKINCVTEKIENSKLDCIAVPFRINGNNGAYEELCRLTRRELAAHIKDAKFKGEKDRIVIWQGKMKTQPMKILVFGVAKGISSASKWREILARVLKRASAHQLRSIAVYLDEDDTDTIKSQIKWSTQAALLSSYRFHKYKNKPRVINEIKEVAIGVFPQMTDISECRDILRQAKASAGGVVLARDLINEPANMLSPLGLAETATKIAAKNGLSCKVLEEKDISKMGMNLLLSVAAGSSRPPCLIHLVYKPKAKTSKRIAIVGKGITFDSGGLCIKPGKSMYTMKTDMGGAAVVLGVMSALKSHAPAVEVHGIIPASDNTINGEATRPGDVFKSMDGITVEVLNTDAEGRLILADAITYAKTLRPNMIIDHATLTGACVIALGVDRAGLFASKSDIARKYLDTAKRTGELFWELPLSEDMESSLVSEVADIKNVGGRFGGAITAALFLKRFVGDTPWIHVDIAGPARAEKATDLCPKGGSGFGVLTLLEFLSSL